MLAPHHLGEPRRCYLPRPTEIHPGLIGMAKMGPLVDQQTLWVTHCSPLPKESCWGCGGEMTPPQPSPAHATLAPHPATDRSALWRPDATSSKWASLVSSPYRI